MKNVKKTEDDIIRRLFDKEAYKYAAEDDKELKSTAKHQIEMIIANKPEIQTALDVGSGTGGVMVSLLEKGIKKVYGVDLSTKMVSMARQRLAKHNFKEMSEVIDGNFLAIDHPDQSDAVSMHRVLCCYPDRKEMLEKTLEMNPVLITLTVPRDDRWFIKIAQGFLVVIRKLLPNLPLGYIHSLREIDRQLNLAGFQVINSKKERFWVTKTFKISNI
jgi:magnesium-protoporphyrin O-methyltransferase